MPIETELDRAAFVNSDEFGSVCTFDGGSISGVFDNGFVQVQDETGAVIGTESLSPSFTCRTSDVSGAAHGSVFVIGGVTYKARSIQPDGVGMTMIELEAQP